MMAKILLFQVCLCHLAVGWRPYKAEFTNVTTFSTADICQINSSISSAGAISIFANVVGRSIPNFYVKTVIKAGTSTDGVYDLILINKTVDACKFFNDPTYEPIVQVFYRELTRTGTFPKRCPIAKKVYFIKDVLIDHAKLPPTIPYKACISDITMMIKSGNTLKVTCGYKIEIKIEQ